MAIWDAIFEISIFWIKTMFQRIIDGLGLIRLFFWFPVRCFWASSVVHVVSNGESNGKSQLAKYFPNSYALESYGG